MPSEPTWSKQIPSSTVCTWFYALAILNAIMGAAGVLAASYLVINGAKGSMTTLLTVIFYTFFVFTNSWFLFLLCNRGINGQS